EDHPVTFKYFLDDARKKDHITEFKTQGKFTNINNIINLAKYLEYYPETHLMPLFIESIVNLDMETVHYLHSEKSVDINAAWKEIIASDLLSQINPQLHAKQNYDALKYLFQQLKNPDLTTQGYFDRCILDYAYTPDSSIHPVVANLI